MKSKKPQKTYGPKFMLECHNNQQINKDLKIKLQKPNQST